MLKNFIMLCLLLFLTILSPPVLMAQSAYVLSYAQDHGVTAEQAQEMIRVQEEMSTWAVNMWNQEPTFAGYWYDYKPNIGLTVYLASPEAEQIVAKYPIDKPWASRVQVVQVEYSYQQLVDLGDRIVVILAGQEFALGLYVPVNKIQIETLSPEQIQTILQNHPEIHDYLDAVEIIYSDSRAQNEVDETGLDVQNTEEAAQPQATLIDETASAQSPYLQEYMRAFGVTAEQAKEMIRVQDEMSEWAVNMWKQEPTYAGHWYDYKPDMGFYVFIASPEAEQIVAKYPIDKPWASRVQIVQVKYSYDDLLYVLDRVSDPLMDQPASYGIDILANKVQAYTPYPEQIRAVLENHPDTRDHLDAIEVVYQSELPQPAVGVAEDTGQELLPTSEVSIIEQAAPIQGNALVINDEANTQNNDVIPVLDETTLDTTAMERSPDSSPYLNSFARDINLPLDQARAILIRQDEMGAFLQQLHPHIPGYAGASYHYQPDFHLEIYTNDASAAPLILQHIADQPWRDDVVVQQVRYSNQQLTQMMSQLRDLLAGQPFSLHTDVAQNKLVVQTPDPNGLWTLLSSHPTSQAYLDGLAVQYAPGLSSPTSPATVIPEAQVQPPFTKPMVFKPL